MLANRFLSKSISGMIALCLFLQAPMIYAQKFSPEILEQKSPQQSAEFIFRNSARDNLISTQVFGSVTHPGVYYVPEDTDLMKVLTLAGGVLTSSELEEVIVRKADGKAWTGYDSKYVKQKNPQTFQINVDEMLRSAPNLKPLRLNHDDLIYVPQKEPFISSDVSRVVTIGSVILTSVLTVLLIKARSK